ncbi:hypothetical protein, partial [Streptomyces sp. MK37H]|uniref:hypothetical protein n=1 Tax=Streptomyces sp. MK37H TaxID=2699117 RepID=UPI001B391A03
LSAKATEEATVDACREDYATGAEARAELDSASKAKAARRGLARGATTLTIAAALAALALTGCSTDSGNTAKRIVESAEPSATGDGADPSTPDVPTGEPDDSPDDGMIALALDDTASYEDGVNISLGGFKRGTSGPYAAPENTPFIRFSITFENKGDKAADLSGVYLTCQRESSPSEEIFDSEHGLDGIPATRLLPGRTNTVPVACSLPADEDYLQVEIAPGLADVAVFSGHVKAAN